jgi:hypothetical protein
MFQCDAYILYLTSGCTIPGNNTLIPLGSNVEFQDIPCVCVDGPDPELMDYATLYHLKCTAPTDQPDSNDEAVEVLSEETVEI